MAVLLTKSWQILGTYRFEYSGFKCDFYIEGKYSSQSMENNTSDVQFRLRSQIIQGQASGYNYYFRLDYASPVEGTGLWTIKNEVISSANTTITHNPDGRKFGGVTADIRINGLSLNTTFAGEYTLPVISRYAIIQSATNFTDEEDPVVTFTNQNLYTVRPQLYAVVNEQNVLISSGESLTNGETSYTFDLDEYAYGSQTQTQRDKLRELCTGQSIPIIIAVTSYSSPAYTSTTRVTMSMINATPTFTYSFAETNENVITVLGSSSANSLIENASTVNVTVTPTTYKHATVSVVNVVYNGLTYSTATSPYILTIPIVNDNLFTITVVDSRGYVVSQADSNRTLINYEAVNVNTFSFKRQTQISSNIVFNGEFLYYSSFGNISNTPVVKWKLEDGSYNTIPSTNYTIDSTNHKLTITNYAMNNVLVYTSSGQFTIYIEDKLTSSFVTSQDGYVTKGIATYDVGEHDLQVNGDLIVADTDRENPVNVMTRLQGAIYEQGTNNNGTYLKYENGVLICYKTLTGSIDITTSWGSLYTSADLILGDFAHAFISRPTITVSPQTQTGTQYMLTGNGNGGAGDGGHGTATNAGAVCLIRPNSRTGVQYVFDIIAIGKWK